MRLTQFIKFSSTNYKDFLDNSNNNSKDEEILKLKNELKNCKDIIENQKTKINYLENQIQNLNNLINNNNNYTKLLQYNLQQKENEIINLKKNSKDQSFITRDQIKSVHFVLPDQVHFSIPCIGNDIFAEVEEKLYKNFGEYRKNNNYFIVDGKQVLRFKTIDENNIGEGKPVQMVVIENE